MQKFGKIEKMGIPDDDIAGWMESLREGGFSNEEIDSILEKTNLNYSKARHPNFIEDELEKIKTEFLKDHGKELTPEEIEYFRKGIKSRLEDNE